MDASGVKVNGDIVATNNNADEKTNESSGMLEGSLTREKEAEDACAVAEGTVERRKRSLSVRPLRPLSMQNGLTTTVPTNFINPLDSQIPCSRHSLQRKFRKDAGSMASRVCYSILCLIQVFLGAGITALAFYTQYTITSSVRHRDTPYWAGIPLFLAGLVGLYYCLVEFYVWKGNTRAFVVKCVCVGLSSACVFLCAVACIFPAAHAIDVFHYSTCNATTPSGATCGCLMGDDDDEDFVVGYAAACDVVVGRLRWYLLAMAVALAVGSLVSLWLMLLIWRSRYGRFHSGLKFYSYSAHTPHPWAQHPSSTNPPHGSPYCQTTEPIPDEPLQCREGDDEWEAEKKPDERKKLNNGKEEEELQLVENKQES